MSGFAAKCLVPGHNRKKIRLQHSDRGATALGGPERSLGLRKDSRRHLSVLVLVP